MKVSRVCVGLVAGLLCFGVVAAQKPNIVYVLCDDLGYGDVNVLNPERCKIATPCLDKMANEGAIFTDVHSGSSVCTPSRYGILTGRYAWRTRLQRGVLMGWGSPLISKARMTVPKLLGQAGYKSACFGKWHLGLGWQRSVVEADGKQKQEVDYKRAILDGPTTRGFDNFYGISASLDMPPYVWIDNDRVTEQPTATKKWVREGPAGPEFEAIDVLPAITAKTKEYIRSHAKAAKEGSPFFIYLPLNAPHTPIVPSKEWQGRSGLSPYADFVMQVDHCMGEILETLDEVGVGDNTLVIFTSDNGCSPAANVKQLESLGHYPSAEFRGYKADIWDGGHRIPFICRWPAKVKAGAKCSEIVSLTDFMATCAEIVGVKMPESAGEDSISFLPMLEGKAGEDLRQSIVHHSINGKFAIREGEWKLALCAGSGGWAEPRDPAARKQGLPEMQLYDLSKDIGEEVNLIEREPERAERLIGLLKDIVANGRSTPGREQKNDVAIDIYKGSR